MQHTDRRMASLHGGPAILSSKTGSFASPPRNGFALYYVSTVTSITGQTLGLLENNIFLPINRLEKLKPPPFKSRAKKPARTGGALSRMPTALHEIEPEDGMLPPDAQPVISPLPSTARESPGSP